MNEESALARFLDKNQLDETYVSHATLWFTSAVQGILSHQNGAKGPVVVGINGCQGSGKSTLADYLAMQLHEQHQLTVAVLSLDDFYYSQAKRAELAQAIHPLLATRGVPGTHNVPQALELLSQLKASHQGSKIALPRFDKKTDEPLAKALWPVIEGPVDVILFEGWCFGVEAQAEESLSVAVNQLEALQDPKQIWRSYVNKQLREVFPALYEAVDLWLMLKAPSFAVVKQWRLEQEQKLAATFSGDISQSRVMDEAQISHFISYFERLTEHCLATLPAKCHFVYQLDEQRQIVELLSPVSLVSGPKRLTVSVNEAVIYTDLDGTLLDHDSYSFAAAEPVLAKLKQLHIPVIPNTSKTAAELRVLRQQLGLDTPFIVENGAAVYLPKLLFPNCPEECCDAGEYWLKSFVQPREHWLVCIDTALASLPEAVKQAFVPMSKMTNQDIVTATGLSLAEAKLAAQRGYGEPLLWQGSQSEKTQFIAQVTKEGANVLEGGRFLHVCGHCNKGKAMLWLSHLYQKLKQKTTCSIALGDGNNDINMLDAADIAVLIKSPAHPLPLVAKSALIVSDSNGPSGWAQVLTQLLQLNLND